MKIALSPLNDQVKLTLVASLIGIMAGYGAIVFRKMIEIFQHLFMGNSTEQVVMLIETMPWWKVILIPTLGGLVVGVASKILFKNETGHGVPEVMKSVALNGGKMELTNGLNKTLMSALSIGCGGSVGREGPVILLGASLASWVGQKLSFTTNQLRIMVGCGSAAGIAASFNAPIAGVVFALEVIMGNYRITTFSPIVVSSVLGTMVARIHLGDYPAFIVPHYTMVSLWEVPIYILLGVLCGIFGIGLMKCLFLAEDQFKRIPIANALKPILGGLIVGIIAWRFPQVMGVGYDTTNNALLEIIPFQTMALLVIAKIVATSITLGSGFSGGIFTPSLFLGAMLGGSFGTLAHQLLPSMTAGSGAYALVGMGAFSACVLGAPITSILILFELTSDYRLILALMLTTITASSMIHHWYGDSVFTKSLKRQKIDIWSGSESGMLKNQTVEKVMTFDVDFLPEELPLRTVREKIRCSQGDYFIVLDHDQKISGVMSIRDLRGIACDENEEARTLIKDICHREIVAVSPRDNLYNTLKKMQTLNVTFLPVIDPEKPGHFLGIVTNQGILDAYNQAILDREDWIAQS